MTTSGWTLQTRPHGEPNEALGLLLIVLIVAFSMAGVYFCSVNSYQWGPAVVVPPQYAGDIPAGSRATGVTSPAPASISRP